MKPKFVFIVENMEFYSSALAYRLKKIEGQDVVVVTKHAENKKILEGLMDKEETEIPYLGQGNIFITEDASTGKQADALRKRGELVVGGSAISDRLENQRQMGQNAMKAAGIATVKSYNFKGSTAFDKAIDFVKMHPGRWVVKQNGEAAKSLSTVGKFEKGEDVIDKLHDFKVSWVDGIDFDLQEFIDGHEVACSGWFNGVDWVRDKKGNPVFGINWEHKKKSNLDLGPTTGETGTLQVRSGPDSKLAKELEKMTAIFRKMGYVGCTDINFMVSKKDGKAYGLEFTNRFGYPALNMDMEANITPWAEFLTGLAEERNNFLEYATEYQVVLLVQVPPFPFETTKPENNAKGQRIYFLKDGKWTGTDYLPDDQLRHIHFHEVKFNKEFKQYEASGDSGYLITVTALGGDPKKANDNTIERIKNSLYVSNMDFRSDVGVNKRVAEGMEYLKKNEYL